MVKVVVEEAVGVAETAADVAEWVVGLVVRRPRRTRVGTRRRVREAGWRRAELSERVALMPAVQDEAVLTAAAASSTSPCSSVGCLSVHN